MTRSHSAPRTRRSRWWPVLLGAALPLLLPAGPAMATPTTTAVLTALGALPPVPDTAYGPDSTGHVLVTVSSAAPADRLGPLLALVDRFGGLVRTVHTSGPLAEQILGGDQLNDGKIICSAGFNVRRDGQNYLLTAGHCTAGLPAWQGIGPSIASSFPGTDYGLIRNDQSPAFGGVDLYNGSVQLITSVGTATVGERVCASGQTTQVTCGVVSAVDQTVDYGDGDVVHGLIETTVHTDHGDSGGALFTGTTGLGMVSGGDGTTDYFQPLAPALTAFDLTLPGVAPFAISSRAVQGSG